MSRIITDRRAQFSISHVSCSSTPATDTRTPVFVVLPAMSERRFAPVEVRGRWWNGAWGRIARPDIWLVFNGRLWRIRGRLGGDGGQEVLYDFTAEASARSTVERMMKTSAGTWRDLTDAIRQESSRRQACSRVQARARALGVISGPMSAHEGDDPAPPRWPADLINALCAWVADELGEPHPSPRRPVCRPVPTSRRRA